MRNLYWIIIILSCLLLNYFLLGDFWSELYLEVTAFFSRLLHSLIYLVVSGAFLYIIGKIIWNKISPSINSALMWTGFKEPPKKKKKKIKYVPVDSDDDDEDD